MVHQPCVASDRPAQTFSHGCDTQEGTHRERWSDIFIATTTFCFCLELITVSGMGGLGGFQEIFKVKSIKALSRLVHAGGTGRSTRCHGSRNKAFLLLFGLYSFQILFFNGFCQQQKKLLPEYFTVGCHPLNKNKLCLVTALLFKNVFCCCFFQSAHSFL